MVHATPIIPAPLAALTAAALFSYAQRMLRRPTPPSRRLIRSLSVALMWATLFAAVRGASFLDPSADADRLAYIQTWTAAVFLVMAVALTAVVDFVNNLRLEARRGAEVIARAEAVARASLESAGSPTVH